MPLKPGSILKVGEYLASHDYIQSANRCFFAIMQDDGNFVVYRGWDPDHRGKDLWATHTHTGGVRDRKFYATLHPNGNFVVSDFSGMILWEHYERKDTSRNYYAILQDDGNFVVYEGTPQKPGGVLWATNAYDSLVGTVLDSESNLKYHLDQAKTQMGEVDSGVHLTTTNSTSVEQTSTLRLECTVTDEAGWSNTLGASVEVSTEFKCGVPALAEGKVGVTVTGSHEHTWSKSSSVSKTVGVDAYVTTPPHKEIEAWLEVTPVKISVPYSVDAVVTLKSGQKLRVPLEGICTRKHAYRARAVYLPEREVGERRLRKAKPIRKEIPADATAVSVP